MSAWLPPPNNPNDFELLCLDLWQDIYRDGGAQKHGRRGQQQYGVDLFFKSPEGLVGVQCKQKDGLLRNLLTVNELEKEVVDARNFRPALALFILATSGATDGLVQRRALELTEEHRRNGLFSVEVWPWEKIWHELHLRPELLSRISNIYWPGISQLLASAGLAARQLPQQLYNVPDLPLNFIERPGDLEPLKEKILTRSKLPVGLTSTKSKAGLHGMGGIGKTVLAVSLARDPEIIREFPHGIFWLTLGESPSLLVRQSQLGEQLGDSPRAFRDVQEGRARLRTLLADRRCLLILDDVWRLEHVTAFDAVGPIGRVLLTTRDASIITSLSASECRVGVLNETQAAHLLARWAGISPGDLPMIVADDLIRECGFLPLALAMIGARGRGNVEVLRELLKDLRAADLGRIRNQFPDYPYPDLLRAIQVSVHALRHEDIPDLENRYLDFAVFRKNASVPQATLQTFWQRVGLEPREIQDALHRLTELSLLRRDSKGFVLHEIQHYYVSKTQTVLPKDLHTQLVRAYRQSATDDWHSVKSDGYYFENLLFHLKEAGFFGVISNRLFDFKWLQAKLEATDVHSLMLDYAQSNHPEAIRIYQALWLSVKALVRDPTQLGVQLSGRLHTTDGEKISELLTEIGGALSRVRFRCIVPSLRPAGSALILELWGHTRNVKSLGVSPTARRVLSSARDRMCKIWDLDTATELRTLESIREIIVAVAFLDDRRAVIATDMEDGTHLRLWDVESDKLILALRPHVETVTGLTICQNLSECIVNEEGKLRAWSLESGEEVSKRFEKQIGGLKTVTFSLDGSKALSTTKDPRITVWDLETGRERTVLLGHTRAVTALGISTDGEIGASISLDQTFRTWDLESGNQLLCLPFDTAGITSLDITRNAERAVVRTSDGKVKLFDLYRGQEICTLSTGWGPKAICSDGWRMLAATDDFGLKLWDLGSTNEVRTITSHRGPVTAVALSSDGAYAISGSADHSLKVWETATGRSCVLLPPTRGTFGRFH